MLTEEYAAEAVRRQQVELECTRLRGESLLAGSLLARSSEGKTPSAPPRSPEIRADRRGESQLLDLEASVEAALQQTEAELARAQAATPRTRGRLPAGP